jgi:hypothetical protein
VRGTQDSKEKIMATPSAGLLKYIFLSASDCRAQIPHSYSLATLSARTLTMELLVLFFVIIVVTAVTPPGALATLPARFPGTLVSGLEAAAAGFAAFGCYFALLRSDGG